MDDDKQVFSSCASFSSFPERGVERRGFSSSGTLVVNGGVFFGWRRTWLGHLNVWEFIFCLMLFQSKKR